MGTLGKSCSFPEIDLLHDFSEGSLPGLAVWGWILSHLGAKIASKTAQYGPKMRPRRAQDGHLAPTCRLSRPQDGPKTAQDGPNRPQIDRRTPQDASKTAQDENSRDLAKNSRDLAKSKAKNKDITHDPKGTPDFKAECCQLSSRPQIARTPKTWGGGPPPKGTSIKSKVQLSFCSLYPKVG